MPEKAWENFALVDDIGDGDDVVVVDLAVLVIPKPRPRSMDKQIYSSRII